MHLILSINACASFRDCSLTIASSYASSASGLTSVGSGVVLGIAAAMDAVLSVASRRRCLGGPASYTTLNTHNCQGRSRSIQLWECSNRPRRLGACQQQTRLTNINRCDNKTLT